MEENVKKVVRFYLLATKLKYKLRSGWDQNHWNISHDRIESIAEHIYGTCILAIAINSEFQYNLDMEKVLTMLTIHEIGEVIIGDITPFDNITLEQKMIIEHQAVQQVLGDLMAKEYLYQLLLEFDEQKTKEAKFAYLCDKMDADFQAKIYQDMGCQHSLNEQTHNVVMSNPKIQEICSSGAKLPFDVWYAFDQDKYTEEEPFARVLKYLKDNNTNV